MGGIYIDWYIGNNWEYDSTNTAQRWKPELIGMGCSAPEARRFATREAAAITLFGEERNDEEIVFRVESSLVDVTGFGQFFGFGCYLMLLSITNNSGYDATFVNQAGESVEVKSGDTHATFALATNEDTVEEVKQVYRIVLELG